MKKIFILALASLAVFAAVSCDKEKGGVNGDLVGSWDTLQGYVHTFNADGTAVCEEMDGDKVIKHDGTWSCKDDVLSINYPGMFEEEYDFRLIGGKAVLILIYDKTNGNAGDILYKKGATIESGTLSDGRWDAPHGGIKPAVIDSPDNDYTVFFFVKGNNLEMYVPAWGFNTKGTFAINNGVLDYDVTWSRQGIWRQGDSYGWNASEGEFNPETFEIKLPYKWEEGDPMDNMRVTQNNRLVVTDDGKEAYGRFANISCWFYKR